jgi:hypothetical protein
VCDLFFTFTGTGSSIMEFDSWRFYGDATRIENKEQGIKNKEERIKEEKLYDLQGRRASQSGKGLFVRGGKILTKTK